MGGLTVWLQGIRDGDSTILLLVILKQSYQCPAYRNPGAIQGMVKLLFPTGIFVTGFHSACLEVAGIRAG
jgi:hypothetical protein